MIKSKVILSDQRVFLVLLSDDYGTIERRMIEDAILLRDSGMSVTLYLLKSTYLAQAAKDEQLEIIFHPQDLVPREFDFNFYLELKRVFQLQHFDFIHIYQLSHFWTIALALGRYIKVPMVLTCNEVNVDYKKNILYKWLLRRLDAVFCFSHQQREIIAENLAIHLRKIHHVGLGIDIVTSDMLHFQKKEIRTVGTFIPPHDHEWEGLKTFITSLNPLIEILKKKSIAVRISFASAVPWTSHPLYRNLVLLLEQYGLDYLVKLEYVSSLKKWCAELSVYINHSYNQAVDMSEIMCQLMATPVVYPRNGAHGGVNTARTSLIGVNYGVGNARDLRVAMQQVLENEEFYFEEFRKAGPQLRDFHSVEEYGREFFYHYEKLIKQRQRLSSQLEKNA